MKSHKLSIYLRFTFGMVFSCAVIGEAAAASLAPHRAVYDLDMIKAEEGSGFSSIRGRMAYELIGSTCEGWTVNFRIANQFNQTEGDGRLVDSQSTSFESGDGLVMKFNQKEFVDNKLQTENRVNVKRPQKGEPAVGKVVEPESANFTLPVDTIFPIVHQLRLIDAAEKGQTRDTSVIFDGSDKDKSFRAISFIGAKYAAGGVADDVANPQAGALKTLTSWPVTISYYPAEDANAEIPSYTVSLKMYENGVSTGLILDYGSFSLRGKLNNLEILKSEPCQ